MMLTWSTDDHILFSYRTALHWACKRNHASVVQFLLANGADSNIKTFKGESAKNLASSTEVLALLGCSLEEQQQTSCTSQTVLPFVPSYLQNPPFPYGDINQDEGSTSLNSCTSPPQSTNLSAPTNLERTSPLVVKVRVHKSEDSDFVEAEISHLNYQALLKTCAEELEISISNIAKIRKLPDILIRKDRDVERMKNGQELEVVLTQ